MKIHSKTFTDGQIITDEKYSAYGAGVFPELTWSDAPKNTKSFALFVHDKDAPIASGFWHLQVVDIPVSITHIAEGKFSVSGFIRNNDTDTLGYFAPRPPKGHGLHEYRFTVYALPFDNLTAVMAASGVKHTAISSRAYAAFFVEMNKLAAASIAFRFEKK